MKVEDLPFSMMMINIMKFFAKSHDKATHDKDHTENGNIDNYLNDCASSIQGLTE